MKNKGFKKEKKEEKTGSRTTEQQIDELKLINSVNIMINRGDSLDEIVGIISKEIKKLFSFRSIGIFLLSSDFKYLVSGDLIIDPQKKKKVEELTQSKISELKQSLFESGYYYKVLKEGKPAIISGSKDIKKFIGEIYKHQHKDRKVPKESAKKIIPAVYEAIGLKSIMVTPLISDGYRIGVFVATSDKDFTDIDLERVNIVSSQLALAMKRKKMEEDLREASDKLDQLFDSSVSAIIAIDSDYNVVKINRECRELFGLKEEDIKGKKCFDVIHGPECKTKNCMLRRIINSEKEVREIVRRVNKHGKEIIVELISEPFYDKKGNITGIIVEFEDITMREKAFEEIKAGEEKFRELFNNMSSGVAVYEPVDGGNDFIIRDFNKAAEEIDKVKREDIIGKSILKVYPGVKDFGIFDVIKSVYKTGKPERHPVSFYKDKRISGWRRNYVYRLPSGEIVAVYDDLTREKIAEKLLKDSEKFSSSLMENSPNPIIVFNADTSIKYVNMALENIVGIKSDKLIGEKPPFPWWPIKDIKKYQGEFKKKFSGGYIRNERYYVNKIGAGFWVDVYAKAVLSGNEIEYVIMNWFDITGRKLIERDLKLSYEKLNKTLESVIETLATMVETRDPYTSGHQRRVAMLAVAIAKELGLSDETVETIRLAATIHDIGKINIPASILTKPGRLTDIEFNLIKTHARTGYNLIKNIEFQMPIAKIILQHHEKLDGSGYPQGLKGEDIMLEAKIITVADVVEAMSSDRPYRPALGIKVALDEIKKNAGKLFDANAVDACVKLFTKKGFKFN